MNGEPEHERRQGARDWIVDSALFVFALLGGLVVLGTSEGAGLPDWFVFLDLVCGVVASCALWLRRRWPLGLAIALLGLTAFSMMATVAGLIALFSLAVRRRFELVALVAGAGIVLTTPVYVVIYRGEKDLWIGVILGVLTTIAVVAWGSFVGARRQLVLSLRDRARRAEAEQQLRVEQARTQERARIAREMHDVLAHRISLVSLHAGALEFHADAPPDEVARAAGVIRQSAHEALEDLRAVIGVLRERPDGAEPDPPQPTLAGLPALLEESRAAGVRVAADCRVDLGAVPDGVGRTAYRVVQEGLTNARKHAHGTAVSVLVAGGAGEGLTVEVVNPLPAGRGAGIPGAGAGIVGLGERVGLAGGRLEHGPTEGGEFRLRACLPWAGV